MTATCPCTHHAALRAAERERDEARAERDEAVRALHESWEHRDRWRANYLTVADAVAAESKSPAHLAAVARATRDKADALATELQAAGERIRGLEAAARQAMDALTNEADDVYRRTVQAYAALAGVVNALTGAGEK